MAYRGIYRDGVIVPGSDLGLPDGARVDFDILRASNTAGRSSATGTRRSSDQRPRTRLTGEDRVRAFMKAHGILRARPDRPARSSAELARELRRAAAGKRLRG